MTLQIQKNATSDFLFIRPSGNTINAEGFEKMISGDVNQEKAEITKIHRFEFLRENIVICIFTEVQNLYIKVYLMTTCPQLLQFLKKWIMFGTFIGCKDLQEIRIYPYGINKINYPIYGVTNFRQLFK